MSKYTTIEIDLEVYKMIQFNMKDFNEEPNDILRRLLRMSDTPEPKPVAASTAAPAKKKAGRRGRPRKRKTTTAAKKSTTAAKKSTTAKKTAAKPAVSKAKKTTAKKATAKKATAKKATAKKTAAKKTTARKTTAKKAPAKKKATTAAKKTAAAKTAKKTTTKATRGRKRKSTANIKLKDGLKLVKNYKGTKYEASVENGKIAFKGKKYDSPSGAASDAVGKITNGWNFWHYVKPDGKTEVLNKYK